MRAKVLYDLDESREIRKSHENPVIKELYSNYLGEPGSHKAHELLHTTYVKRSVINNKTGYLNEVSGLIAYIKFIEIDL